MLIFMLFYNFFQVNGFESELGLMEKDFFALTTNLIENLRVDPFLNGDSSSWKLSQTSQEFIDKRIELYTQLVLTSREKEFFRSKRSLETKSENQDYITDIKQYGNSPAISSKDVIFFNQNSQWYSVSIEKKKKNENHFNLLRVQKYQNASLTSIAEMDIQNGVKLAAFPLQNSTIIVVAENATLNYTNIYELNSEDKFNVVQKVGGSGYHDVNLWEDNGNVFMSLVGFMANSPVSSSSFRVYKWRGRHFDVLQNIHDTGITGITPFQIGDVGFLAVAKNTPRKDEENIYSDILKYNVETNKYELFQRILTYACEDMKYFEIDTDRNKERKEGFLIVANFYKKDPLGKKNYQTLSIVYKFVDNYFIPFQSIGLRGVRQWEPITNENGEVLLVALTLEGLRTFQYDGWLFTESKINFKNDMLQDANLLHSYRVDHKNLLVIVKENATKNDHLLFEITFSINNRLGQIQDNLLNWCQKTTKMITKNEEDILEKTRKEDKNVELKSESQTVQTDLEKLTSDINTSNSRLVTLAKNLNNSLQFTGPHIIIEDIQANRIHINSNAYFDSIITNKINSFDVDSILKNVLNINEGFRIDSEIKIDFLRTEQDLEPKTFNNHPVDTIVYKDVDINLDKVRITGDAIFKDDILIGNLNNAIKINADSILLINGDQNLGSMAIRQVNADKVDVKAVNGHPVDIIQGDEDLEKKKVTSLKALKTKNLIVGGFLNDINVQTLEKFALRKSGKQDITAETYYFDRVESELLETDRLSGFRIPEDLILINKGEYIIPKSLLFTNLTVHKLQALRHLDSITVNKNGNLDVLLKNAPSQQHVTGTKILKNLETLNPIDIRGKIKGKDFEKINPLKRIASNLIIQNNVTITGDVLIEELLKSTDVMSKSTNVTSENVASILRVIEKGIKLEDENIDISVKFLEHLNIQEINVDTINNEDTKDWVVTGAKHPQVITGLKTFKGDLEITGNTNILMINNIDTKEFENNVLKTNGDQVITGKHEVKDVHVVGRIKTNNIKYGKYPWKDVITTTGNQTINSTGTLAYLRANLTSVKNIKIKGKINGIDLSELVQDSALIDSPQKIFGTKTFKHLNIQHLWLKNFDVKKKLDEINNKHIILNDLKNIGNITANKVYFNDKLNGIDKIQFQSSEENVQDGKLTVEGDHKFDQIIVYGTVFLESNQLNHIDIDDLEENSVKTDQPEFFQNVEIADIFVPSSISLEGLIENFDLDNVFENGKEGNQNFTDKINFHGGVSVTGDVNINGQINGVKLLDLCDMTSKSGGNKKLKIEGNVHFIKGPRIANFNDISLKDLNNVWFTNKPATLQGKVAFLGNVTMREDTTVQGLLNDINIEHLSTNYLSKTKDQNIFAHINFSNATFFLKNVTTPHLLVEGLVNDIDLKEFVKSVLLHRNQLFEDTVYFDEVETKYLEGNYLVNKLNLDSEVMRYDRPNLITGPKSFRNLDVDVLRPVRREVKVQEVDVGQWIEGAVLKEGDFKIAGRKKFGSVEVKESTNIIGRFNNIPLNKETVMLKNTPQNITGTKTFLPEHLDGLKFKALKIKGLLNGDNFLQLINNQATRNGDNVFESPLMFSNDIHAKNVNFKKHFMGIDISKLLHNIGEIGTFHHIKKNYKDLIDMAGEVEKSLRNQAFYLDYFKPVPKTFNSTEMFSINCGNQDNTIINLNNENGSNIMSFLDWDERQEIFNTCCSKNFGRYPNYMNKIKINGMDAIYLEHANKSKTEDYTHTGQLLTCKNKSTQLFRRFLTKGTIFMTAFQIKSINYQCLLFIDFIFDINIPCSGLDDIFHLHQTIKIRDPIMASVEMIDDIPYLVTIHKKVDVKTVIWKLNEVNQFEVYRTYYAGTPTSLSTISSVKGTFLAVAYKHLPNTKDFGKIVIRRYDKFHFPIFQNIRLKTPTNILFSRLPSGEIALYITTKNPSEPFIVYLYEGVSGFVRKIESSTIPTAVDIKDLTLSNQHFVVVKHNDDMSVLQGVFKGNKHEEG